MCPSWIPSEWEYKKKYAMMKKNGIFNLIYYNFNLPFLNVLKLWISYTRSMTQVPVLIIADFIKETIQFQ